ncbi:MAG TPA: type II toxin-antitoxin system PemK/MazF family toxin [Pseudolabrys sp.]|nr:type II toxin-antitoxin system PemK/MazF family toxin [Pseudolabrys sp.]
MKRGDVVLMVAPGDLGRPRPGVVVQSDDLGSATTTVLVCPLTSDVTENLGIRPIIEPASSNGLRARSQIMTDKLLALRRDRIRTTIGKIDANLLALLDRALLIVLGLARRT